MSSINDFLRILDNTAVWQEYFSVEQHARINRAFKEGTLGAVIKQDDAIAMALSLAALDPQISSQLNAEQRSELQRIIGKINPQFNAGWQSRWQNNKNSNEHIGTVESAVRKITEQLRRNPAQKIWFQGKEYELGQADINGILNLALANCGSDQRVFMAPSARGSVIYVLGRISREVIYTSPQGQVRAFELTHIIQGANLSGTEVALSDGLSVVAVLPSVIQRQALRRDSFADTADNQKQQSLRRHVDKIREGSSQGVLKVLNHAIMQRQVYANAIEHAFGCELSFLSVVLHNGGEPTLEVLRQLYADLGALDAILSLQKSDPPLAQDALVLFSAMKDESISQGRAPNLLVNWLTLPFIDTQKGQLQIDWAGLGHAQEKLKQVLHAAFAEIANSLAIDAVGDKGNPRINKSLYESTKTQLLPQAVEMFPHLDSKMRERMVAIRLAQNLFGKRLAVGKTVLQQFAGDMRLHRRLIDDFFRESLAYNDNAVPFREAPVVFARPKYMAGKLVGLDYTWPDLQIASAYSTPVMPSPLPQVFGPRLAPWQRGALATSTESRVLLTPPPLDLSAETFLGDGSAITSAEIEPAPENPVLSAEQVTGAVENQIGPVPIYTLPGAKGYIH